MTSVPLFHVRLVSSFTYRTCDTTIAISDLIPMMTARAGHGVVLVAAIAPVTNPGLRNPRPLTGPRTGYANPDCYGNVSADCSGYHT